MFVRKMLRTLLSPTSPQASRRRKSTLRLEALEDRTVPSGFALDASGVLTITGDQNASNTNDQISVSVAAKGAIQATLNGVTNTYNAGSIAGQVTAIKVLGLSGSDTLTLGNIRGLPGLSGGLTFDGGRGTNTLVLQGTSAFSNEAEAPTGPASGNLWFDGQLLINYSNVTELDDTTSISGTAAYKGTSAADTINVSDGGTVNGVQATRLDSGLTGTFATVYFANKPTVKIDGIDGPDTVTLNNPNPATGLATLIVNTGPTAGAALDVLATAANVTTDYVSGGNALVTAGNAGSVQGIQGPVNLQSALPGLTVTLNDSADATRRTVTLDRISSNNSTDAWGTITGLAPAVISYDYLSTRALIISAGTGGNTFNVSHTMGQPGITTICGGTGSNTFSINGAGLGANSINNFYGQGTGTNVFSFTSAIPAGVQVNCLASLNDPFSQALIDEGIQALARTDYNRDNQFTRADMLDLFNQAEADGAVTEAELQSLRAIVANWQMPDFVSGLSSNVLAPAGSNLANANYQGQPLAALDPNGNVGSATLMVLYDLVQKWFYGSDHPAVPATASGWPLSDNSQYQVLYRQASGTLFASSGSPSYNDVAQGVQADCGLLSALGELALRYPRVIQGMFVDNGDGTYTVRFYNNGVPTYVTVDKYLPVLSNPAGQFNNQFYAAGFNQFNRPTTYDNNGNVLWVALAEKAYAQLAEEGWSVAAAINSYVSAEIGQAILSAHVMEQVTGARSMSATVADVNSITETMLIDAWQQKDPITMATGNHTWMLTGYDPSTGNFTFTNPYQDQSVNPLSMTWTWADLIAWCKSYSTDQQNHGQFAILFKYRLKVDGTLQSLVQGDWTSTINQVAPSDLQKWQSFAVGGDGSLYALKVNGQLWRYLNGSWNTIDTGVQTIAVGGDGSVYDLETTGQLWRYQTNSNGQVSRTSIDGPNLTGGAAVKSIAVGGDGSLYDLETNGQLWQYQLGAWGQIDGPNLTGGAAVKSIAVGGDGSLDDLETNGQLWQYQLGAWGQIDGPNLTGGAAVESIAVAGDGSLDELETTGQLWRYQTNSNTGQVSWTRFDSGITSMAVAGDGSLYALTTTGSLTQYPNGFRRGSTVIDTNVQAIAVGGDGSLYKLTTTGDLWQYQFGAWSNGAIATSVQAIAVGGDGSFYKLMTTGDLWQYQFGSWSRIDTGVQTIAVGGDGSLYDLETNGQLWQYQLGARGSSPIDSNVKSIVVDYTGTLYDLETNGYLWSYQFGSRSNGPISTGVLGISVTPFGVLVIS